MYDFHKVKRSVEEIKFRHPFFQRGREDLLVKIKRKTNSGYVQTYRNFKGQDRCARQESIDQSESSHDCGQARRFVSSLKAAGNHHSNDSGNRKSSESNHIGAQTMAARPVRSGHSQVSEDLSKMISDLIDAFNQSVFPI